MLSSEPCGTLESRDTRGTVKSRDLDCGRDRHTNRLVTYRLIRTQLAKGCVPRCSRDRRETVGNSLTASMFARGLLSRNLFCPHYIPGV